MPGTPIHPIEGVALDSTGAMVTGSLAHEVKALAAHIHEQGRVWPTMANGVTVISANANWALGNKAVVMPAGTVATPFRIHALVLETMDKNAVFELVLYQGPGAGAEVSRIRFSVAGGFFGNSYYVLTGPLVPGGVQLQAALASSNGLAEIATATISVCYHIVV